MSSPTTCVDTARPISSPASVDGLLPYALPAGPTINPSGPGPVPVSRFRARDSEKAMPTNDTSGPLFTASSPSARLQSLLENRLRARMGVNGSPEYALTWKYWGMPAGPPICALRASARRTSGSGFFGWPTPMAQASGSGNSDSSRKTQELLGWRSPQAGDGDRGGQAKRALTADHCARLTDQVLLVGWATPRARDGKGNGVSIARAAKGVADSLGLQCKTVSQNGTAPPSPFSARTDRRALPLNPCFSLWLQGYPATWAACAVPVTRSSRKSRQSS